MRVSELAKELGVPSKAVMEKLTSLKVPIKGPMSTVGEEAAAKIRKEFASEKTKAKPAAKAPATKAATRKATAKSAVARKAVTTLKAAAVAKPAAVSASKPTAKTIAPSVPAKPKVETPPVKPVSRVLTAPPALKTRPATVAPAAPLKAKAHAAPPPATPAKPAPKPAPVAAKAVVVEEKPAAPVVAAPELAKAPRQLRLNFPISVKDLAMKLELKPSDLIKHLMGKRIFASLNQALDQPTASQIATDFGYELAPQPTLEEQLLHELEPDPAKLVARAPVVTFMGHVDHGKTSLLDVIRESKVAEKEAGGITQHIGAYEVILEKGHVTFLDTPGHEAFTALRARGANVTDVVVLVVAADDGVMPQTIEAIDHAKAAEVPIVVAINKIDRPEANPQKIKQQLTQYGLVAEDWGGKTIMVPVSAKTRQGIDDLLEMLLLEAELLELKADPTKPAQGAVIDAKLTKDRGPIATLLIQQGTLKVGDLVVVGSLAGRVRAMINDRGHRVKETKPASPVEILGLPGVPKAGDRFLVLTDEKLARSIVERRQEQQAEHLGAAPRRITLDDLHQRITEGKLKELKLILKVDVQGSLEAITQSLGQLADQTVKLTVIHTGVGDISESDVMLAAASDAVIIGFHVGMDPRVQVAAINEGVDVRIFQIIYELVNAIKASLEGLLEPKVEEIFLGRAEVKRLFQISRVGIVAGCMVTKGTIRRDATIRVIRGKERILETKIANLKHVKDDVREVSEGVECGISLEGKTDLQPGDLIEAWELKKVARKLA